MRRLTRRRAAILRNRAILAWAARRRRERNRRRYLITYARMMSQGRYNEPSQHGYPRTYFG